LSRTCLVLLPHFFALEDFLFPDLPFWVLVAEFLIELFHQLRVYFLFLLHLADVLVNISSRPYPGLAAFFGLSRPFFALFDSPLAFLVPGFLVGLRALYTLIIGPSLCWITQDLESFAYCMIFIRF